MTSTITRWATATRHCARVSRKDSPATPAAGAKSRCRLCWPTRSTSRSLSRSTANVARSPSARRSYISWSTNRPRPKMLFDMMKEAEQKAGGTAPAPEPRPLDEADKEVLQTFVERVRQQVLAEIAEKQRETAGSNGGSSDDG